MKKARRVVGVVGMAAALFLAAAVPASAHQVRYGTNGGLGGNVFYNVASGGQTYCVKGSGWMDHPGSGGAKARSSVTTWFRKGANASVCGGSSSTAAAASGICFGHVTTAVFRNGLLEDSSTTNGGGGGTSSLTAALTRVGFSGGAYTMRGDHYWNSSWPGSCQGSPNIGQSWSVNHNL